MSNVDVLVAGGGPTGLIVSYALLRYGLDVLTVEQYDKEQQAMYGRACVIYSRSLEILDQLGLYDRVAEAGYTIKGHVTYKGREETTMRGWSFIEKTVLECKSYLGCLGIRQKMSEAAFREAILELDPGALRAPAKLLDFTVEPSHEYPVCAKVELSGVIEEIHSKYLIGADGGHSTVRSLARIPFPGSATPFRWIRMDAIVRTDMPCGRRGSVSVESPRHGNVLWSPIDNGGTRIGFVCPPSLYGESGEGITTEVVIAEAQEALKPFTLEIVRLDWWTIYNISQRVAERFREGHVLLAGDAAHTHSSGAAQGMNTGIHDASNLAWKLAGVLKGWYTDEILDTYDTERRASVLRLIQLDKDISSLISGVIPAHFDAPPDADANAYLDGVHHASAAFTVGLGINYGENIVNQANPTGEHTARGIRIGHRPPDVLLHRPGAPIPKRLQELTPNRGRFWILVFPGGLDPTADQPRLRPDGIDNLTSLRTYIKSPESFVRTLSPVFEFLTVVRGDRIVQTAETLGGQPLGKAVYDQTGEAYGLYGVDEVAGAIVVLRPDGIVTFVAEVNQFRAVERYFAEFVRHVDAPESSRRDNMDLPTTKLSMGEIYSEAQQEKSHVIST